MASRSTRPVCWWARRCPCSRSRRSTPASCE
jgi:hypothetical protein